MIRGTTPLVTITLQNDSVDLTAAKNVYVTFAQNGMVLVRRTTENVTLTAKTVAVLLSQAETVKFVETKDAASKVKVQVNWTYEDGRRGASEIALISIDGNLLPEVLV